MTSKRSERDNADPKGQVSLQMAMADMGEEGG